MDQPLARIWAEFRENRIAVGRADRGGAIALIAPLAPLIAPQNPYDLAQTRADGRAPPAGIRRLRRLHAHSRH